MVRTQQMVKAPTSRVVSAPTTTAAPLQAAMTTAPATATPPVQSVTATTASSNATTASPVVSSADSTVKQEIGKSKTCQLFDPVLENFKKWCFNKSEFRWQDTSRRCWRGRCSQANRWRVKKCTTHPLSFSFNSDETIALFAKNKKSNDFNFQVQNSPCV